MGFKIEKLNNNYNIILEFNDNSNFNIMKRTNFRILFYYIYGKDSFDNKQHKELKNILNKYNNKQLEKSQVEEILNLLESLIVMNKLNGKTTNKNIIEEEHKRNLYLYQQDFISKKTLLEYCFNNIYDK